VQTRTLNTLVINTITGASLATNKITLAAGTYRIKASAPCNRPGYTKSYLYNVSDSSIELTGASDYATSYGETGLHTTVVGGFTIASEKEFELRHYTQSGQASNGLGLPTSFADAGLEIHSEIEIFKES
jgi:hypothetical protein